MKYIATISFGKDSTVMCDLLLKNGYPVDYIVFNDTLDEYEMMYEYKDKVTKYFKDRYNKEVITTKPKKRYEDYIFHRKTRGEHVGKLVGLPNPTNQFCEWRGIAKRDAFEKFIKDNKIKEHKIYVGFTIYEANRRSEDNKFLYPLIDNFMMSERDCQEYLIKQEMQNPLYNYFSRTGCVKCQYKSDKDWYQTWKYFPEEWKKLKDLETRVCNNSDVLGKNIFSNFRTCEDMEKIFKQKDKQGTLFDFSDEPLKDCFCKT